MRTSSTACTAWGWNGSRTRSGKSCHFASSFDLAYNAAHALCLAALRWHGWRSTNRFIVFQLLPHTLGLGPEVWRIRPNAMTPAT